VSIQFSSALKHCCPKCGGDWGLIYGKFMKPMNCLTCLKKNPAAWARHLKEELEKEEKATKRLRDLVLKLSREKRRRMA
jgi:hypothetical protein